VEIFLKKNYRSFQSLPCIKNYEFLMFGIKYNYILKRKPSYPMLSDSYKQEV